MLEGDDRVAQAANTVVYEQRKRLVRAALDAYDRAALARPAELTVATVAGFPSGKHLPVVKAQEAALAVEELSRIDSLAPINARDSALAHIVDDDGYPRAVQRFLDGVPTMILAVVCALAAFALAPVQSR